MQRGSVFAPIIRILFAAYFREDHQQGEPPLKLFTTIALALLLAACSSEEPSRPAALTTNTEGNRYHNAFFGVTVEKPEGWYSQPPEETIALQQRGTAMIAGDREDMRAMVEASLEASVPLFGFFEVPPGTPDKLNPNVMSVAENLAAFPGLKSGCDYLAQVRKLLEQSQMPYQLGQECSTQRFAGVSLDMIEGTLEVGGTTVSQRYYATLHDQHALAFVQTYFSEEGRLKTQRVLDSLVLE